jgi:hypothetical protein
MNDGESPVLILEQRRENRDILQEAHFQLLIEECPMVNARRKTTPSAKGQKQLARTPEQCHTKSSLTRRRSAWQAILRTMRSRSAPRVGS